MSALSVTERRWRDETASLGSREEKLMESYVDAALEFGPERMLDLARTQFGEPFADSLHERLIESEWSLTNGVWIHGDDTWRAAA